MLTYEVTAVVPSELREAYEKYMIDRHIPDVLSTGAFVVASLSSADPGRYRIRYEVHSREALDSYLKDDAPALRQHFAETFPEGIELSREEWTVLAGWVPDESGE
jgi:hypothetical protein